jgi:hypothetical protein
MDTSSAARYMRRFSAAVGDRVATRIFKFAVGIDNVTATQIRISFSIGMMHDALVFFFFFFHHEVSFRNKNPCQIIIVPIPAYLCTYKIKMLMIAPFVKRPDFTSCHKNIELRRSMFKLIKDIVVFEKGGEE